MATRSIAQNRRTGRGADRAPASSTVRVRAHVHATLQELSSELGEPIQDVVEDAVEAFRRQLLLDQHNRAYAALRADPERWRAELEERAIWDAALADGLEEA